ncbi:MAG: Na+/H+ antiporter NhaA [Myxococcota bacterium]
MATRDQIELPLPREPIHRITVPIAHFLHIEAASGGVLLACTAIALMMANSDWSAAYLSFWKTPVGFGFGDFQVSHSLKHWINDGLMAVFFFVIGLEVKREIAIGELGSLRKAALPVAGALGGMIVPAGIYLVLQSGQPGQAGWGIPMATDIAFVVGCLAVLGSRVPHGLRVMLLSLAIVDDIGAILVIAIGYTSSIDTEALILGAAGIAIVAVMARLGVRSFAVYTAVGALTWFGFHESGIHATIAGVILGLMTPPQPRVGQPLLRNILDRAIEGQALGRWDDPVGRADRLSQFRQATLQAVSPLEYVEHRLHPWVGFVIMPVFALANAGVPLDPRSLADPVAFAVAAGLMLGKPLGIVAFVFVAVRLGIAQLPVGLGWGSIVGGGVLAGIGFTMALFISELALGPDLLDAAKIGVFAASALSMLLGLGVLALTLPQASRSEGS